MALLDFVKGLAEGGPTGWIGLFILVTTVAAMLDGVIGHGRRP
jgi:hypothetical protein